MIKRLLLILGMVGVLIAFVGMTWAMLQPQPADAPLQAINSFLTISMVTYEALRVLFNQLKFTKQINRQFDSMFAVTGAKIGSTANARKPPRYVVTKGQAVIPQDMVEVPVPITLTDQANVALQASTADFALSIDDFSNRFLKPAAIAIANQIDFDGLSRMTPLVWHEVGTPGTNPTTAATYLAAKTKLDNAAAPNGGDRCQLVSAGMEGAIVNALTTIFNPTRQISDQYLEGSMGKALGADWYMDQNTFTHTVGTIAAATATVSGANQTGATINTAGWTAGDILNVGDVVQFTGTNEVNPQNRQSVGDLMDFTVTAQTTATAAGLMAIPISPAIVIAGQFQNVTASPSNGLAVRVFDSATVNASSAVNTPQGLLFHPDFCTLVTAPLPVYEKGVVEGYRVDAPELGISLRVIKAYNVLSDQLITRVDVLYGWSLLYGELACRVCGAS